MTDRVSRMARQLANYHLARQLPQRWWHVYLVAARARYLCAVLGLNDLAVAAAWVHDIGYAPELRDTGFHQLDGARYLRSQGWDELVCRLVANHTDALRQADHLGLGGQLRDEFPDVAGLARDVLWTADATTGPRGQRMSLSERIAEISERYGPTDFVTRGMIESRPAIEAAIARVRTGLVARGGVPLDSPHLDWAPTA